MSRRLTGWVLTAAVIAASPVPVLSSNDTVNFRGGESERTASPMLGLHALDGARSLAEDDRDYTDCLEVVTPREFMILRDGKILDLQQPYPTNNANRTLRFDSGTAGDADEQLLGAIDRSKRAGSGPATLPWPSLPIGKLLPEGKVLPHRIDAACGIPEGLTLLLPAERGLRLAAAAT